MSEEKIPPSATYEVFCAATKVTYLRDDENLFDDLIDILDYNNNRGRYYSENTSLKGSINGGSMDDRYLGEAVGVREILAWVLRPGFFAKRTSRQVDAFEKLLKRIQSRAKIESEVASLHMAYDVTNVMASPEENGLMMTALLDVAQGMDLPVHEDSEGGYLLATYAGAVGIHEDEWSTMFREWEEGVSSEFELSPSGWNDAKKEWLSSTIWGFVRDSGPAFVEGGRRAVANHRYGVVFMSSELWHSDVDSPSNSFGVCCKVKGIEDGLLTVSALHRKLKFPFMPAAVSNWGRWSADWFERLNGYGALILWALHESSGRRLEVRLDHLEVRGTWHYSIHFDDDVTHRKDGEWQECGMVISWLIGLESSMFHHFLHEFEGEVQPHVAGEETPFGRLMGGSFELRDRNPELIMIGNVSRIEFDGLDSDERDVLLYSSNYHVPPSVMKMVLSGFGRRVYPGWTGRLKNSDGVSE